MDLIAYLHIFRRRWLLLVVPMIGAVAVAWLTLPTQAHTGSVVRQYSATATLISSPSSPTTSVNTGSTFNLNTAAVFATVGEVPKQAAKSLGFQGEPQVLASLVTVNPSVETSTMTLTSTDTDASSAAARANAFAQATVDFFRQQQTSDLKGRLRALNKQVRTTSIHVREVQQQLAGTPNDPLLNARLDALTGQVTALYSQIASIKSQLGGHGPLTVLQRAVEIPQGSQGFNAPRDPRARLIIAALLGLVLGAAVALLVERIDSRLRSREQAEASYALPVLAEIPALPFGHRDSKGITSARRPGGALAESYRTLRSALLVLGPEVTAPSPGAGGSHQRNGYVVLVTSALPGEGKTTTVANLAVVLAETGRQVLVMSMDLRNPRLHTLFETPNAAGISDLLADGDGSHLEQVVRDTGIRGVRVATGGQQLDHPGALLASAGPMLRAARATADVVLVDTAPLLTVSDTIDLVAHTDVALVVSRLNRTTTYQASAAQRLLSRLGIPALGLVLVGGRRAGSVEGYRFNDILGRNGGVGSSTGTPPHEPEHTEPRWQHDD
jgi:capsular exopolysaccharide synthesis family protein